MAARRGRRGNAAVVGLSLAATLGFGALAVDVGMQRVADAQVQMAIEAGVLGGAAYLDGTIPAMQVARDRAARFANVNGAVGNWSITAADVEVGVYADGTFTAINPENLQTGDEVVQEVNALRIRTRHEGLRAVLSGAVGGGALETRNQAIAMRPPSGGKARTVPCYLPLAIPDCKYMPWLDGTNAAGNPAPVQFLMTSSNVDNVGWGNPFMSNFGSDDIKAAFANDHCHDESLAIGDDMHVKNGQNNTVLGFLGEILNHQRPGVPPTTWDEDIAPRPARDGVHANCPKGKKWDGLNGCIQGNAQTGSLLTDANWGLAPVIEGPVALVTPPDCGNTQFVGTMPISGFAWAMIYDVADHGSEKNIFVQLDFINEHEMGGDVVSDGSGLGNVLGKFPPQLVNP